jgi:hypothetical protein
MSNSISSINRRNFLMVVSNLAVFNLIARPIETIYGNKIKENQLELFDMKLRPHHILDIVTDFGNNQQYQPHPYGHSLHIVAPKLLSDLNLKIKLIIGADDVCTGCTHLMPDGKCNDVLSQLKPSPSKQAYNDVLDSRIFDCLSIDPGIVLTTHKYLELINDKTPGIEEICTHPKENKEERLRGLTNGLVKLGFGE